ncbi:MAG TPA: hypothetical protein VM425_21885 [Myxococcota bacterium]|nr:hypothetical protein [Myxococcota bacterium]
MPSPIMKKLFFPATLSVLLTLSLPAAAQVQRQYLKQAPNAGLPVDNSSGYEDVDDQDEQDSAAAADQVRKQQAEANFDSIVLPQNAAQAMPIQAAPPARGMQSNYNQKYAPMSATVAVQPSGEPGVEVPLHEYLDVRKRLLAIQEEARRRLGPAVVLGSSEYDGEAVRGALQLRLALRVTLGREGKWKTVPLIGDDVVLVKAAVDGKTIPVSRRAGYHVWATRRTGEVAIQVDLLVPARGPRGSIEYDFLVPRTPVTRFSCRFPVAGLKPRIDAAVQSETTAAGGGTLLRTTLSPTARIHLVGFHELAGAGSLKAKVYAESLNLLSIDEGVLDLFSVVRYTILYAGAKEFDILVPKGYAVVAADGMGAFRYTLAETEHGTVIRGETAFPIRNNYEISIRLHRETPREGEEFAVPFPRCMKVEREIGYLGIEVPGKLKLEEGRQKADITSIDVRQLPEEMVRSAVSPILRAYRYHSAGSRLELATTQLPEKEPATGSIDRIRAFTTVTGGGQVMTDMRITLRNRLRHSLSLSFPEGIELRSAMLDGQPVKPSRNEQGRYLLPLKRSGGIERLLPFTISIVMHGRISSLGLFGCADLFLPAVDLPVSSLAWSVYLPARNIYTRIEGDIEPQMYAGRGSWYRPSFSYQSSQAAAVLTPPAGAPAVGPMTSAHAGAMPVRIKLPAGGIRLEYSRYWIDQGISGKDRTEDSPVVVSFHYLRSWLTIPAWMTLACLLALGMLLVSTRFSSLPPRYLPWLGGALSILALWPLHKLGGLFAVFIAVVLGLLLISLRRKWFGKIPQGLADWALTLRQRFAKRTRDPKAWTSSWVTRKMLATIGIFFFGLILLDLGLRFLWLLLHPL